MAQSIEYHCFIFHITGIYGGCFWFDLYQCPVYDTAVKGIAILCVTAMAFGLFYQLRYGRDSVEPAIKPGDATLTLIKGVTWLLQRFPQLADRF